MDRAQRQDSSIEPRRPSVIDAPDWFNRARTRANQRQVFHPRPVPLPGVSSATGASATGLWRRPKVALIRVLPLVALPIVFGIGFWTRGVVGLAERETASVGESGSVSTVVLAHRAPDGTAKERAAIPVAKPVDGALAMADHAGAEKIAGNDNLKDSAARPPEIASRQSLPSAIAPAQVESVPPKSPRIFGTPPAITPADGFSLQTPGLVRQVSAEVVRPTSTWFETVAQGAACTTGKCPAPIARLDRKLNTALEWSSTPEAAAELAEREGKLVFLIHVSGNFAQPGFT